MLIYVKIFFIAALILSIGGWGSTGFKDLSKPYIYVACPENHFQSCLNPYFDHCKLNDCSKIDYNLYQKEYLRAGESIGEKPPFFIFMLPTALTLLALILSGLCITKIKKNEMAKDSN